MTSLGSDRVKLSKIHFKSDLWEIRYSLTYGHYFIWRIFFSQNLFSPNKPVIQSQVLMYVLCKKNKIPKLYTLVQLVNFFFWSNEFSRTSVRIHSIVQSLHTVKYWHATTTTSLQIIFTNCDDDGSSDGRMREDECGISNNPQWDGRVTIPDERW